MNKTWTSRRKHTNIDIQNSIFHSQATKSSDLELAPLASLTARRLDSLGMDWKLQLCNLFLRDRMLYKMVQNLQGAFSTRSFTQLIATSESLFLSHVKLYFCLMIVLCVSLFQACESFFGPCHDFALLVETLSIWNSLNLVVMFMKMKFYLGLQPVQEFSDLW